MIKQSDIKDWSSNDYLENNSDFSKQLVVTLNQVDDLSDKNLRFRTNVVSVWDYRFNKISYNKWDGFSFWTDEINITSPNRDDLLNDVNCRLNCNTFDNNVNFTTNFTFWQRKI